MDVVAAVFLFRADGAALLQLRDDKPGLRHAAMWVPPGGHCDPGETPLDGARREFVEETGYLCQDLHYVTYITDHPDGSQPFRLHVFCAAYDGVQSITCHEGQALEFIARAAAPALAMPDFILPLWDQALAELARHQQR